LRIRFFTINESQQIKQIVLFWLWRSYDRRRNIDNWCNNRSWLCLLLLLLRRWRVFGWSWFRRRRFIFDLDLDSLNKSVFTLCSASDLWKSSSGRFSKRDDAYPMDFIISERND
jgi:hypothetical protein